MFTVGSPVTVGRGGDPPYEKESEPTRKGNLAFLSSVLGNISTWDGSMGPDVSVNLSTRPLRRSSEHGTSFDTRLCRTPQGSEVEMQTGISPQNGLTNVFVEIYSEIVVLIPSHPKW